LVELQLKPSNAIKGTAFSSFSHEDDFALHSITKYLLLGMLFNARKTHASFMVG